MIGDTIHAVSSPPGTGARAVLRISGPAALEVAGRLLERRPPRRRAAIETRAAVVGTWCPCLALVMPGPGSYTGEDVVELHVPGAPALVAALLAALGRHSRPASPGEFTRRACEAGRLDLLEAEGVLALICAEGERDRRAAFDVLRGGPRSALAEARAALLDARAMLEAGLDFLEGETGEVRFEDWAPALRAARARVVEVLEQLPATRPGGEVLVIGAANAGKSSLCNALAGREAVLVSGRAGTTRDVVEVELENGVRLLDTPGELTAPRGVDAAALRLRDELAARAGAALLVVDGLEPRVPRTDLPVVAVVVSKADLARPELPEPLPEAPCSWVSARTGEGVDELRDLLARSTAQGGSAGPGGLRACVANVLAHVDAVLEGAVALGSELCAAELDTALAELETVCGGDRREEVLDRIFARFCLGK